MSDIENMSNHVQDLANGRRIYVQEACFTSEALRSPELLHETAEVLASLTIPRTIAHTISELEMFGTESFAYSADDMVGDLGFRKKQTHYMQQFPIRQYGEAPTMALREDEAIVANCFFSNYYTLATDELSAKTMFADNSSVAQIKSIDTDGLLLIVPKMLPYRPNKKSASAWVDVDDIEKAISGIAELTKVAMSAMNPPSVVDTVNKDVDVSAVRLCGRLKNMIISFLNT